MACLRTLLNILASLGMDVVAWWDKVIHSSTDSRIFPAYFPRLFLIPVWIAIHLITHSVPRWISNSSWFSVSVIFCSKGWVIKLLISLNLGEFINTRLVQQDWLFHRSLLQTTHAWILSEGAIATKITSRFSTVEVNLRLWGSGRCPVDVLGVGRCIDKTIIFSRNISLARLLVKHRVDLQVLFWNICIRASWKRIHQRGWLRRKRIRIVKVVLGTSCNSWPTTSHGPRRIDYFVGIWNKLGPGWRTQFALCNLDRASSHFRVLDSDIICGFLCYNQEVAENIEHGVEYFWLGVSFHQSIDTQQLGQLVLSHHHLLPGIFLDKTVISLVKTVLLEELSDKKPRVILWLEGLCLVHCKYFEIILL